MSNKRFTDEQLAGIALIKKSQAERRYAIYREKMKQQKKEAVCSVCGIGGKLRNGFCQPHYLADWKSRTLENQCKVDGCERGTVSRMMCESHYRKYLRTRAKKQKLTPKNIADIKTAERERIIELLNFYGYRQASALVALETIRFSKPTI